MFREAIKTTTVIILVVILGAVAGDLDVIENTRIGDWYLPALVRFLTFVTAALLTMKLAVGIGRSEAPPVLGSPGLSRITQLLLGATGVWFLHSGLEVVVTRSWRDALNTGASVLVLALLALAVGVVYTGFDELAASLGRLRNPNGTEPVLLDPDVVEDPSGIARTLGQTRPIAERLATAESLRMEGLLDEEEYALKRRSILDEI